MTILLALLGKLWPYLAAGAVAGAATGWTVHEFDSIAYSRLQTTYASYQTQVADADAKAQEAARNALQAQVDARATTDQRNQGIIDDLTKRATSAESDRDFARQLLGHAGKAGPPPASGSVSQANHQPGASAASGAGSGPSLETEVAVAVGECEHDADQLDALIAEIKPQL